VLTAYRVTLIGVFLGHFRINLHQTRTQYSSEGPQHWNAAQFPNKKLSYRIEAPRCLALLSILVSRRRML